LNSIQPEGALQKPLSVLILIKPHFRIRKFVVRAGVARMISISFRNSLTASGYFS